MFNKSILFLLATFLLLTTSCGYASMHTSRWTKVIPDVQDQVAMIKVEVYNEKPTCLSLFRECDLKIPAGWRVAAIGTGFVVSSNGKIVTNFHVVYPQITKEHTRILVQFRNDDRQHLVYKTYSHPEYDMVILQIKAKNLHPVKIEKRHPPKLGEEIVSAGWNYGDSLMFSPGIVGLLKISPDSSTIKYKWYQTTVQIYPGFSGGPVFNRKGHLVGINNAHFTGRPGFGLIIPARYLLKVLEEEATPDTKESLEQLSKIQTCIEKEEKNEQRTTSESRTK